MAAASLLPSRPGPVAQERKAPRLGWLDVGRAADAAPHREAVRQALVGYVSIHALVIEERYGEGRDDRLPALADELVKARVDVIFGVGAASLRAARQATATAPIVVLASRLPGADLGRALADVPANVTGVTFEGPQLSRRRLELVKQIVPSAKRVALRTQPGDAGSAQSLRETQTAAEGLGVTVTPLEARDDEDLVRVLTTLREPRPDALILPAGSAGLGHREQIVSALAHARLPALYPYREFIDAGALASYGPNLDALYRRAGALIGKVLIGTPPRDLPIEAPSRFELVVNRKAARAIGLEVPAAVLNLADEVR